MSRTTYYLVLPFVRTPNGELLGIEPEAAPSELAARASARGKVGQTVGADMITGAIAVSRTGDPQLGDFSATVILARFGETPEEVEGMG